MALLRRSAMWECESEYAETDQDGSLGVTEPAHPCDMPTEPRPDARAEHRVHSVGAETEHDVGEPEDQCLRPHGTAVGTHELRKEREEEDRDFGVQQCDHESFNEEAFLGLDDRSCEFIQPTSAPNRFHAEEDQIHATNDLDCGESQRRDNDDR